MSTVAAPRGAVAGAAAAVLLPFAALFALLVGTASLQQQGCGAGAGGGDPISAPVGALGGIGGTGITRAELATVRSGRTPRLAPGQYQSTAYGPPWGGMQGAGVATAGGLHLGGGAPRKYFVAVDPRQITYGTWLYIWPNPFDWRGAFLAADTGDLNSPLFMQGRRIDFYDWRGRQTQNSWGRRQVRVSAAPVSTPVLAAANVLPAASAAARRSGASDQPDPAATTPSETTPDPSAMCDAGVLVDSGQNGPVQFAPGANRPGAAPTELLKGALGRVAGIYGQAVIVTTGTNHNQFTTSGGVSDHWAGNAADVGSVANHFPIAGLGRPGGNGDKIAAAAMIAAGVSPARAAVQALAGGLCNIVHGGLRWQVIWKTNKLSLGGDHTNHVHIGVRPQSGSVPMSCIP